MSVFALGSTLLCRYLLVFPSTTWFTKKRGITFTVTYLVISYGILSILFYPLFNIDEKEAYKMAFKVEPCLQNFIEPGFLFVPYEIAVITLFGGFSMFIGILCFAIALAIYFIYLVKTNISVNSKTFKFSNYLMISAIFQLSISIFFNFIPFSIFMGILAFKIPFTENLMIINFCFLSMHSFLEFLATLYCVTPYRKAVVKMFYYFFRCKNHAIENNLGQISVVISDRQAVAQPRLTNGHQRFRRQPLAALSI
uniref:Uncharacterized protein n=1 Tax=Panagrolaimus davidi TaxID=227884 RepID=A0A914QC82_9BILA